VTDDSRFVVYYRGPGDPDPADVARILALPGVRLIDQELSRIFLVNGPEALLRQAVSEMPPWTIGPERAWSPA